MLTHVALTQLHGGTSGLRELGVLLFGCVPLMLLGLVASVVHVTRIVRARTGRSRSVHPIVAASLVSAAGLIACGVYLRNPHESWLCTILYSAAALFATLAALSWWRHRRRPAAP